MKYRKGISRNPQTNNTPADNEQRTTNYNSHSTSSTMQISVN